MNRFFLDLEIKKLKQPINRFHVLVFFCCVFLSASSLAQQKPVGAKGAVKQGVKRGAGWQEELFVAYFDTIPRVAVDAYPSKFNLSPSLYQQLKADSVNLFKGIQELKNGNTRLAINYLRKSSEGVRGLWYNNSDWYLGLAFLRINELPTAEYLIYEISEMEIQPYQLLAAELYNLIMQKKPTDPE